MPLQIYPPKFLSIFGVRSRAMADVATAGQLERRCFRRIKVELRAKYQTQENPNKTNAIVKNLTEDGAGLLLPEQFPENTILKLEISPSKEREPIRLQGEVSWQSPIPEHTTTGLFATGIRFIRSHSSQNELRKSLIEPFWEERYKTASHSSTDKGLGRLLAYDQETSLQIKRFFYKALESQWNPETAVDWNKSLGIEEALCPAMAHILSPIVMGEYSAFQGIPQRILSFSNYEVKQYLSSQLVDETRHAEAFDLYLSRIQAKEIYKGSWRNVHVLRYFNQMKRLRDDDEWLAGLLVTEITAHVLLSAYIQKTPCQLTQQLFKKILADEARHIGFVNYYLRVILRNISENDRESLAKITDRILCLTQEMLQHYQFALKAFDLDSRTLFSEIHKVVSGRAPQEILKIG